MKTTYTLKCAISKLDQGKDAIQVRQKHNIIRIANHSDWGVIEEYEADKLSSNSDDERKLYKVRKEWEAKKRKATTAAKRKLPRQEGASLPRQPNSGGVMKQPINRTRPIGPCYNYAGWGHLVNSCPKGKQQPYPLSQPIVNGLFVMCMMM